MEAQGAGTAQDQARGFWAWNGPVLRGPWGRTTAQSVALSTVF